MTISEALTALEQIAPDNVAFAAQDPQTEAVGLWPQEEAHVARAVCKRRREFAAGRRAARIALGELGEPNTPLLARKDRVPIWPKGVVGSISHCSDICVVIAAKIKCFSALGVDVECNSPLKGELVGEICTPVEQEKLLTEDNALVSAKRIFSAKEAAFKAQYTVFGKMVGFHGIEISFGENDVFEARFPEFLERGRKPLVITGRGASLERHFIHIAKIN